MISVWFSWVGNYQNFLPDLFHSHYICLLNLKGLESDKIIPKSETRFGEVLFLIIITIGVPTFYGCGSFVFKTLLVFHFSMRR